MTSSRTPRLSVLSSLIATGLVTACGGGGGAGGTEMVGASALATSSAQTSDAALKETPSLRASNTVFTAAAATSSVTSTLTVTASGSSAGGINAQMEVYANGSLVGSAQVRSGAWNDYSFSIASVTPGETIDILFTNDDVVNGEDRNLFVQAVTVDGKRMAPSEATYDRGWGAEARDGKDVIAGQEGMWWAGALRFALAGSSTAAAAPKGIYVDQATGNDGNLGTVGSPFKTLNRVMNYQLKSGDGIYLRCGQTWRESLTLNQLQLVEGTTIAGYGDCSSGKAVISGADDFSGGWTKNGNVWSRKVPTSLPKIARLFVNGASSRVAQWPNQVADKGYAIASNGSANSIQVSSADLATLRGRDLRGATAQIRTVPWAVEGRTVDSLDEGAGFVRLAAATENGVNGGDGYVLQDKLWMLDVPGEFFHDVANGTLYVYPADANAQANLNGTFVEGSVRDISLFLSERANLSLSNVALRMARTIGLLLTNTPQVKIDAVESSSNGTTGLAVSQWAATNLGGPTITNSSFVNNWMYGIDARYVSGAQIKNNRVTDTGTIDNAGGTNSAIYAGVGATVDRNIIDGAAYHGIHFSGTGGTQITRNTITNYCKRLSDCGALYTWNGPKGGSNTAGQNSNVESNQIGAATANADGAAGGGENVVVGIYLDDYSYGVSVKDNTIQGPPMGIFVHNGSNNTVAGNRVWLTGEGALHASMDQTDQDYMTGNVFRDNELVPFTTASAIFPALPTFKTAPAIAFGHALLGTQSISTGKNTFSSNRVVQLNGSNLMIHAHVSSKSSDQLLSASEWMSLNPGDATPTTPMTFGMYSANLGPELVTQTGLNLGGGWGYYFVNALGSAKNANTPAICAGLCLTMTSGTIDDLLYSSPFTLAANTPYLFTYTATSNAPLTVRVPYISQYNAPWGSMAQDNRYSSPFSRSGASAVNYQAFFTSRMRDTARVNLQLETFGLPVTFSGVSIKEVTGYTFSKPSDWAAVAFANYSASKTVSCQDLGWPSGCTVAGLDGKPVSLPLTLPAGTQQLLLRTNSGWLR